jgi:hypothetical protein
MCDYGIWKPVKAILRRERGKGRIMQGMNWTPAHSAHIHKCPNKPLVWLLCTNENILQNLIVDIRDVMNFLPWLTSNHDPLCQVTEITGVYHHARPFVSPFYIYLHVYTLCHLPLHTPVSRQNCSTPFSVYIEEKTWDNKKDKAFLLVWDKDSHTERFLALLPCTCVL